MSGAADISGMIETVSNQLHNHTIRMKFQFTAMPRQFVLIQIHVAPFRSGLDLVQRLQPIAFDWKADSKRDLGLAAEDVAKVEPLLVTYNSKGEVEGVKYDRVGVVLLNAMKEQQAQIETQAKQIEELKTVVCSIKPDAAVCTNPK